MSVSHTYRGNAPLRLNKWMAELGLCSRREAEALIGAGVVRVDENVVEQPGHKIEPGQTLTLSERGQKAIEGKFTAVLNKPVDYVSAQPEGDQVPAARLITKKNAADGADGAAGMSLAPLGRLDQDSRGLLLLSEDGVLAKAIIGPHHALEKEYLVKVSGKITPGKLTLLRNGLSLDGRKLKPAKVTQEDGQRLRFVLKEGRKRQIRRMCDLVGLKVVDLVRLRIGPLEIGDLQEGQWRLLKPKERADLIAASLPEKPKRLRDEDGKPIKKGRSFVGRGGAKPNREIDPRRKDGPRSKNDRGDDTGQGNGYKGKGTGRPPRRKPSEGGTSYRSSSHRGKRD
ncbi:MAG: pseudouridine synthase [Pseudomonadota bacterium]